MANDMPCCPSQAPAPAGCDKCVLMAACMSQCFTVVATEVRHPPRIASESVAPRQNDSRRDGVGRSPPEHPPRTLV
jgi:hypothetical protein